MPNQPENTSTGGGAKGRTVIFAICAAIIIALLGTVIYLLKNQSNGGQAEEPVRRNVVVNKDNIDKVLKEMDETTKVPVGSYEVKMNSTWNFPSGDAPSDNAYVENVVTNSHAVYLDVLRADTEEAIYKSPILPLGSHLEEITLDEKLPAGTYDCVAEYHLLDEKNISISTVRLKLTVVVAQ